MRYLTAVQVATNDGYEPLPGENDVLQFASATPAEVCERLAAIFAQYPEVYDFDITVTNQDNAPEHGGS